MPDPTRKLYNRVRNKLERIRNSIQTGLDPTEGAARPLGTAAITACGWMVRGRNVRAALP